MSLSPVILGEIWQGLCNNHLEYEFLKKQKWFIEARIFIYMYITVFVFSIKYVGFFTAALIMIQVAKDYWSLLGDVSKSDVSLQLELFYWKIFNYIIGNFFQVVKNVILNYMYITLHQWMTLHNTVNCLTSLSSCLHPCFQLCLVKHLFFRALLLLTLPVLGYVFIFYIHLSLLTKAGPHDNIMTSAFQASLEVHMYMHF